MAQALLRFLDDQYVDFDGVETKFVEGRLRHLRSRQRGRARRGAGRRQATACTYFQGHNEQGAAHMAIGFAKQSNRRQIFAVTSSIGPGALNMVTAAGVALVNRIPVLFLPGDAFACRQPDPVLQQVEQWDDYTATANDAFRAVSPLLGPDQPARAAHGRLHQRHARAHRPGGDRPRDPRAAAGCPGRAVRLSRRSSWHGGCTTWSAGRRPRGEIDRAVALIRSSSQAAGHLRRRRALLRGGRGACRVLRAHSASPSARRRRARACVPWDDPLNLGGIGVTGGLAANRIARDADLVIAVGTRLGDFTTGSRNLFRNPRRQGAHHQREHLRRAQDERAVRRGGRAGDARRRSRAALGAAGWKTGYTGEVEKARAEWRKEEDRLYTEDDPAGLSQVRLLGELNEKLLPKNAIVVGASGSLPGDLQRVWRTRAEDSYHMEYGFSCMGYEIAAALGAKMAAPDREVFALVGDGSYVMLHSELLTAIQEDIKIHVIVFDNAGYQCIDNLQQSQGIAKFGNDLRKRDPSHGQAHRQPHPAGLRQERGKLRARGILRSRTLDQFRAAVKSALAGTVSTVIDVKVTPKSMTHDYESWWRVGTAQVSENPKVEEAARRSRGSRVGEEVLTWQRRRKKPQRSRTKRQEAVQQEESMKPETAAVSAWPSRRSRGPTTTFPTSAGRTPSSSASPRWHWPASKAARWATSTQGTRRC